jgi:peptidoglycan/xylan/chitin deacetylase (PgdA/CDA1 family)
MPLDKRQWALNTAMDLCHQQGIHATFFFTARPAALYDGEFEKLRVQGHEIGCHGLTHGDEENYDQMPEAMQRTYIQEATETLQDLLNSPVRAFRSPRVKTSAHTLRLLADNGYWADSSVCSQRMDLASSNLINVGWIFAPRRPYHPHRANAFRAGDLPIWEIPVSAMVVPFISSALGVLGLTPIKNLFRLLYAESRRTGKPIVYLAHPSEFVETGNEGLRGKLQAALHREYFTPAYIRTHGLRLRKLLHRANARTKLQDTQKLFAYMASFPDITFQSVSEYVHNYLQDSQSLGRRI